MDDNFDFATAVCLFLFSFEMMLSCFVREDYFPGFWFLADLFATASLIFDLTFVSELMVSYPEITPNNADNSKASAGLTKESEYARASRSSRVGSRIARILRVMRLARVGRLFKFAYMGAWKIAGRLVGRQYIENDVGPGETQQEHGDELRGHSESRVGKKLSARTPQRVILIVLALLFVLPHLDPGDNVHMMSVSAQYGADVIYQAWVDLEVAASNASFSPSVVRRRRWEWEAQVLIYLFEHRYDDTEEWLHKLAWVGFVRRTENINASSDWFSEGYWQLLGTPAVASDEFQDVSFGVDALLARVPEDVLRGLQRPWDLDCTETQYLILGISLDPSWRCLRRMLRPQETMWYMPIVKKRALYEEHMQGNFVFVFNLTAEVRWQSAMGIMQTVLVVFVLAIGALLFSRDVDQLVLLPIERMISKVNMIRHDPLYAIRMGQGEGTERGGRGKAGDRGRSHRKAHRRGKSRDHPLANQKKTTLETKMLENTIIKLGSLLALGFGEAGVGIIAENLEDQGSGVSIKIPGSKVEAIFGFCDIRHFNLVTEVLKEQTMVFVNQVAAIVHEVVDQHLGAPNKNLGQAFLLVWQLSHFERAMRPKVADLSVMAFIKVVSTLGRDRHLSEIVEHPLLQSRMPNFRVSMGFGLHLGWAIAGAIGSERKIDASYLSPHVNLASQLEVATQVYGSNILMSEPLVRSCSHSFSRHFRPIDRVRLSGSQKATMLFTVDLHSESLYIEPVPRRRRVRDDAASEERRKIKSQVSSPEYEVHVELARDRHVRKMRAPFSVPFLQEFECGFLNYLAGEWDVAGPVLAKTRTMLAAHGCPEDGPSTTLHKYLKSHDFTAPTGWPGWRDLQAKQT